jgi:hypothetical protein
LVLAALVLIPNIGGHFAEDDEGAYLYASWRIACGDALYRDILTSKPLLTFLVGSLIVDLFGLNVVALRLASALTFASTAAILYFATAHFRLFRHAWLVPVLFVLHPDAYVQGRFFRPDVFALFFSTAGMLVAIAIARGKRGHSNLAVVAGLAFSLAMLCKFNALITLVIASVVLASFRRWRDLATMVSIALGVGILVAVVYELTTPSGLFDLTIGHHLLQSADIHSGERVKEFLRSNVEVVMICFASFLRKPRPDKGDKLLRVLMLCAASSLLVFLFIEREIYMRHFLYLAPLIALLAPPAIESAASRLRQLVPAGRLPPQVLERVLLLVLLLGLGTTWEWPAQRSWTAEAPGIADLAEGVRIATPPATRVLSDYAVVNFLAGREGAPMTPQISQGSVRSGEIDKERVLREISDSGVGLVLIHTQGEFGYRYGVQDKNLSPSHLISLANFDDLISELDKLASDRATVLCSSLHFELWVLDEKVDLPDDWGPRCTLTSRGV